MTNIDTTNRHLEEIIKYLGKYLPPVNDIYKKKHAKNHYMRRYWTTKKMRYAMLLNNINKDLVIFHGLNIYNNMGDAEMNQIILYSMTNGWDKQYYLHVFFF